VAAVVVKPVAGVDHAVADHTVSDRAAPLAAIKEMLDDLPGMITELEDEARGSAQAQDYAAHSQFSRLATVFGEFRNGLADYFARAGSWGVNS
jgi:hypothetical protein